MQNSQSVGNQTRPQAQISLSAISEALNLFQSKAGVWILASLIYLVVQILGTLLNKQVSRTNPLMAFAIIIIFAIVNSILYAGIFGIAIKQIKGHAIEVGDLFNSIDFAWPVFWASFMMGILIAIGLVFCIIPGIILAGLFLFAVPLIIDQKLNASDAISTSFATLKSQWLSAAIFALVVGLIYFLGAVCLYVGLIVTLPIAVLSITVAYRDFFLRQIPPSSGEKFEPAIPPGS